MDGGDPPMVRGNATAPPSYHQCLQSQSSATAPSPSVRIGQHYDPVHESREWYQDIPNTLSNTLSQSSHLSQTNPTNWTMPPFVAYPNLSNNIYHANPGTLTQSYGLGISQDFRMPFGDYRNNYNGENFAQFANHANVHGRINGFESIAMTSGRPMPAGLSSTGPTYSQLRPNTFYTNSIPSIPDTRRPIRESATSVGQILQNNYPIEPQVELENIIPTPYEDNMNFPPETRLTLPPGSTRPRRRNRSNLNVPEEPNGMPDNYDRVLFHRRIALGSGPGEEQYLAAYRGAIASSKKVTLKAAIASLEAVKLEDLDDESRSCMICYNDFCVKNPEGVLEVPLRIPECKHVFGDRCIKKWLKNSASCPYCRDKLPSENFLKKYHAAEVLRLTRERMFALGQRTRTEDLRTRFLSGTELAQPLLAAGNIPSIAQVNTSHIEDPTNRDTQRPDSSTSLNSLINLSDRRRQLYRNRSVNTRLMHTNERQTSIGSMRISHPNSPISPYSRVGTRIPIIVGSNTPNLSPVVPSRIGVLRPSRAQATISRTPSSSDQPLIELNETQYSSSGLISLSATMGANMSINGPGHVEGHTEIRNGIGQNFQDGSHSFQPNMDNNASLNSNGPGQLDSYPQNRF